MQICDKNNGIQITKCLERTLWGVETWTLVFIMLSKKRKRRFWIHRLQSRKREADFTSWWKSWNCTMVYFMMVEGRVQALADACTSSNKMEQRQPGGDSPESRSWGLSEAGNVSLHNICDWMMWLLWCVCFSFFLSRHDIVWKYSCPGSSLEKKHLVYKRPLVLGAKLKKNKKNIYWNCFQSFFSKSPLCENTLKDDLLLFGFKLSLERQKQKYFQWDSLCWTTTACHHVT